MLRFWRWLKAVAMPASGKHARDFETRRFWADEDGESWDLPPEDEPYVDPNWDFPVACPNGCPQGYLGRHKFSCPTLRETSVDLPRLVRPYVAAPEGWK